MNIHDTPGANPGESKARQDKPKYGVDPYLDWLVAEGIPGTEDYGVDLFAVETAPWLRYGVNGAAVHLKGRGDFATCSYSRSAPVNRARRSTISTKKSSTCSKATVRRNSNSPTAAGAVSNGARKACSPFRS